MEFNRLKYFIFATVAWWLLLFCADVVAGARVDEEAYFYPPLAVLALYGLARAFWPPKDEAAPQGVAASAAPSERTLNITIPTFLRWYNDFTAKLGEPPLKLSMAACGVGTRGPAFTIQVPGTVLTFLAPTKESEITSLFCAHYCTPVPGLDFGRDILKEGLARVSVMAQYVALACVPNLLNEGREKNILSGLGLASGDIMDGRERHVVVGKASLYAAWQEDIGGLRLRAEVRHADYDKFFNQL